MALRRVRAWPHSEMLRRYNRLLVATHIVADAFAAATAFLLAYYVRFESSFVRLVPVTKGQPPLEHYLLLVPFLAVLVPLAGALFLSTLSTVITALSLSQGLRSVIQGSIIIMALLLQGQQARARKP